MKRRHSQARRPSSNSDWMYYYSEQVPHNCERKNDHDDLFEKYPGRSKLASFKRGLRRMFLCSQENERAVRFFRSQACINFEKSRQFRLHPWRIHPFSMFRASWEAILVPIILISSWISIYELAFEYPNISLTSRTAAAVILSISDILWVVGIVFNMNMGRRTKYTRRVELELGRVVWTYLSSYFLLDAYAAIPFRMIIREFAHTAPDLQQVHLRRTMMSLGAIKECIRVLRTIPYILHTCEVLQVSYKATLVVLMVLGILFYFHCTACIVFIVAFTFFEDEEEAWIQRIDVDSTHSFDGYFLSLVRTIYNTLGLCYRFLPRTSEDQLTNIILGWIGAISFLCLVGKVLQYTIATTASNTKYRSMVTEVAQFMNSRKLPKHLQKRVLEFYDFRFQGAYFNENMILKKISRPLREDYKYQQCRNLVENVSFFTDLPNDVLVKIVAVMKVEFFQGNETVIQLNSTGSCMYFIKSGTVAIYASSGKEVCHLEDGNHFGEIALVLAHFRRVAKIVAIEDCELYRLEREDFNLVMAPYPQYLDTVRSTAMKRLERTMRLESDNYKSLQEYIDSFTDKPVQEAAKK